jgi:hypothetical protein
MKKSTTIVVGVGAIGIALMLGAVSAKNLSDGPEPAKKPVVVSPASKKPTASSTNHTDRVKACIAKSGMTAEKVAASHIIKVTGGNTDDIISMAEIFTNYTGDLISQDAGRGKIIASAFASCYQTKSGKGLVTVYNQDGQVLSNGNY